MSQNNFHKHRIGDDHPLQHPNKKLKTETPQTSSYPITVEKNQNINIILPVERLFDILLLCEDMLGLLRVVCFHWKNIIDSQCKPKLSPLDHQTPKTLKHIFFSSLKSYEYIKKQTNLTTRVLCQAIRHKTLSLDVAKVAFQTTLVTNKVLFALGETGSIDLLNILAKDWPFVQTTSRSKKVPKDWRSFITFAFVTYPDTVLEWVKENQNLFFPLSNTADLNANFLSHLTKDFKFSHKPSFTSVDKFLQCYREFPHLDYFPLYLKFPTLLDYINVFHNHPDLAEKSKLINVNVLIMHIIQDGRLNFIQLSDELKIQRLECLVIQLTTLCKCLPHHSHEVPHVVKKTMASLLFNEFYVNNWIKGLKWMIDKDFIPDYFLDLYHPTTKEMVTFINDEVNKGCVKLNCLLKPRYLIPRLIVSPNVELFQKYVLDRFTSAEMKDACFLKPDLISLHSVVGKWLIQHHLYHFIQLFLVVDENFEENRIPQFLQTFDFHTTLQKQGSEITDELYQKIVYWVHVARRRKFYFTNETPPPECHIAVNITHGLYGDHNQLRDMHQWLFDQFKDSNQNFKFQQRSDFNWGLKDVYHFTAMYPILQKYITQAELLSFAQSLSPSDYKKFFNFLVTQKIGLQSAKNNRLFRQRYYYYYYYTILKHNFNISPISSIQENQLQKYSKSGEAPESNRVFVKELIHICITQGSIHHVVFLFENKIITLQYFKSFLKRHQQIMTPNQLEKLKKINTNDPHQ